MFLKKFFESGAVTVVNALRALAINKLLAIFLPPAAFACVGQFLNLMSIGQATSSLALQNGWTSLTAKNAENEKELLGIWRGGVRITTFATLFTFIAMVLFCFMAPLETLFPGMQPRLVQAAILFAMPGILASNVIAIVSSAMVGLGENRKWALINVVTALWQILWVAAFLYTGKLSVLSVIATQSILGAFFAAAVTKKTRFRLKYIWSTALDTRRPWHSYALMGIVPMVLSPIVLTIMRTAIDGSFGHNAAGLWQSVWKFSDFIFMVISAVLTVTVLPAVSKVKSRAEFNKVFYPKLFFVLGFSLVLVGSLFLGRNFFVPILFSNAYLGAADYMQWQLVGDFFRAGGFTLALVLISRQETKKFIATEIFGEMFLALGTIVGMKYFYFSGPMLAYAAENILYFLVMGVLVWRLKWNTP
ncbi:MAG: O-antigen translocase [Fibrobacter sp.]|nr:O-antigen translocase [Fibrobacter sp.]